ncbi:hypothetical protein EDI_075900 [Entamoeba dispar SAW760]|uniref:Transcription initiation factor TFIID subunit 2 n=1 Tax=Entamoeba dispar (strain ATCC PRA-260 / SAW760) TaxID=370354 RepID=B0EGX9_ENTDS|nr:uncharacterized protein EDI_075900 [Entamoeba dispar SAW760]EDR26194.1 hypothetical protein EDI_075900 [Entamoeba dispar SAW760]|eukprot:EDR26194.1 hypothetical protein EDI_075900 [Entamoeba dispar SAW760]
MEVELTVQEETIKFISINEVFGKFIVDPQTWKLDSEIAMTFLMSDKTVEFVKNRGIILHVNRLIIDSISLELQTKDDSPAFQCHFTQTPGILDNEYPLIDSPTYSTFEEMYKGSIGQLTIFWPEKLLLNSENSYVLRIVYKTNKGSGLYTTPSSLVTLDGYLDTASWMPCICNSFQLVCYEMTFIVPDPYVVIATGNPSVPIINGEMRTFNYTLKTRIPIKSYGFIIAPVKLLPIESSLKVGYFSGPVEEKRAQYTLTQMVPKAIQCIKKYTSTPEPFSLSVVISKELPHSQTMSFAGLIIISTELLYLEDNADRYRHVSFEIGRVVASQWVGHYIIPNRISDEWITLGIRDYLAEQFIKTVNGQNYVKYKSIESQELVLYQKWGEPLHTEERKVFAEMEINDHFRRKVDIAMGVMENNLGKDRMKKLVCEKVLNNGEPMDDLKRNIKTRQFVKELQTQNSSLMKQFEERLVNGTGYSKIAVSFTFTQRTIQTDFKIHQSRKEKGYNVVPVRIHEVEQTIEDTIELTGEETSKSIPCHSRIRKQRKRPIKTDTGETIMYDLDSRDCKRSGQGETDVPILYIEIDPDNDYPRRIKRDKQSFQEYMWLTQLEFVRTVRGQLVTIEGLEKCKSEKGINALFDFLINNHRCFYKVQIAAAHAIARMSCEQNGYLGFHLLKQFYKTNYYEESVGVIPLDFSNPLRYELQKGLIGAFADVRVHNLTDKINWGGLYDDKHKNRIDALSLPSYPEAVSLLLEIAENSTNERNKYQDGVFIKSVIGALGKIVSSKEEDNERITKFLKRELNKDKIIPSDRNIVTLAVIKMAPGLCDLSSLCSVGNFYEVRVAAIRALLKSDPQQGLITFVETHERGDSGRVRYAICEMALTLKNFPPQDIIFTTYFRDLGNRVFKVLCNRHDYVKNKIMLALVFKKWWGDSLVQSIIPPIAPTII